MLKCISLEESIVLLNTNLITPFQIGLALQLYQELRSKQSDTVTLHAHAFLQLV